MSLVDDLLRAAEQHDPSRLLPTCLGPLLDGPSEAVLDEVAFVAMREYGTLDTGRNALRSQMRGERARALGPEAVEDWEPRVPSEDTIKACVRDFGQRGEAETPTPPTATEDDVRTYDVGLFNGVADAIQVGTVKAAFLAGGVQDRAWAAGVDGHWTPSSGSTRTNSGRAAQLAIEDDQPIFPGRSKAHNRHHLNIQADSLEPMSVSIREGRHNPAMLTEQLNVLAQVPGTPRVLVGDKAYNGAPSLTAMREYTDPRLVPLAVPQSLHRHIRKRAAEFWNDGKVQPVLKSGTPLYWAPDRVASGGRWYEAVYFFADRKNRRERKKINEQGQVTTDLNDSVYVFVLLTNIEVTDPDVAWWLYHQYRSRWGALEAYFRALVRYVKSQAHDMLWKNFWYLASCLNLNTRAIWRLARRQRTGNWEPWTKDLDYSHYLEEARDGIAARFRDKAREP